MGIIFSKNNKIQHFVTPTKFYDEISGISSDDDFLENIDPRSPCATINRTPVQINQQHDGKERAAPLAQSEVYFDTPAKRNNPNLKEKLLKKLGYNLKDPRSPSHFISRTPIVQEKEYPSSDSSTVPSVEFKEISSHTLSFKSELLSVCKEVRKSLTEFHSEQVLETNLDETPRYDPRSPSIGIERTPLYFDSSHSSTRNESNDSNVDEEINKMVNELISDIKVYTRKSLELKQNTSFLGTSDTNITRTEEIKSKKLVYEELDDVRYSALKATNTPKAGITEGTSNRTPLQCLGNKTQSKINERVDKVKDNYNLRKQLSYIKKNIIYNDENDTPDQFNSVSKLIKKSKIPLTSSNRQDN